MSEPISKRAASWWSRSTARPSTSRSQETHDIGRGHASDIRIASHFVSRVHAKISTNGVATVIEDAGSKNGLLVNSERVLRRVLRDGDVVSLGDELNMRFVDARH